ncbi:MAG: hypothetical protein AAGD01_19385 [Acidobacteriota bacterium]
MSQRVTRVVDAQRLEIAQKHEEAPSTRGVVPGYWRSDGNGQTEELEPEFFLSSARTVGVETSTVGTVNATLYFYSRSTGETRPPIPQEGGSDDLGPGAWTLSISGSISLIQPSRIEIAVQTGDGALAAGGEIEATAEVERSSESTFTARAKGNSRPQAIRVAYQHAEQTAGGKPFVVLDERVYAEKNYWICILTCQFT